MPATPARRSASPARRGSRRSRSPRARSTSSRARKTKVQSWYLDVSMIADYWAEGKRAYHHTAPISMVYALREALRIVLEEGLEARFARHRRHSAALMAGLAALGCAPQAQEGHRLPTLNCVQVPAGVEEAAVRKALLAEHGIEIGGGLGPARGQGLAHRAHGRGRAAGERARRCSPRSSRRSRSRARRRSPVRDGGCARGVRARLTSRLGPATPLRRHRNGAFERVCSPKNSGDRSAVGSTS